MLSSWKRSLRGINNVFRFCTVDGNGDKLLESNTATVSPPRHCSRSSGFIDTRHVRRLSHRPPPSQRTMLPWPRRGETSTGHSRVPRILNSNHMARCCCSALMIFGWLARPGMRRPILEKWAWKSAGIADCSSDGEKNLLVGWKWFFISTIFGTTHPCHRPRRHNWQPPTHTHTQLLARITQQLTMPKPEGILGKTYSCISHTGRRLSASTCAATSASDKLTAPPISIYTPPTPLHSPPLPSRTDIKRPFRSYSLSVCVFIWDPWLQPRPGTAWQPQTKSRTPERLPGELNWPPTVGRISVEGFELTRGCRNGCPSPSEAAAPMHNTISTVSMVSPSPSAD